MIEKTVIQYLDMADGIHAYAERPKTPEGEYLLVERTGGSSRNGILRATIVVQSWADSLLRAAEWNRKVEKRMAQIPTLTNISSCKLNSSYNYTDTESKKYRYQAVFDITYMESEEES